MSNSVIYGESPAEDCPAKHNCYCENKMGFQAFVMSMEGRDYHVTTPSPYPLWNFHAYGTWGASTYMSKLSFNDFKNETACGAR